MSGPSVDGAGLSVERIADQDRAVKSALLDLNNAYAHQTSHLTPERWEVLVSRAFAADCLQAPASLLLAFDQDADYDSANFIWFRSRFSRFVYVDRIVVDDEFAGRGLARRLYQGLFRKALAAGHDQIVCEVNLVPPNPGSDAFHARLGFAEAGRGRLAGDTRSVRYLTRKLDPGDGAA